MNITHSTSSIQLVSRRSRTRNTPAKVHSSLITPAPGWSRLVRGTMTVCDKYDLPGESAFDTQVL